MNSDLLIKNARKAAVNVAKPALLAACKAKYRQSNGPVKLQDNKLFVMTYNDQFTCNPRYVVEELLRRRSDLDIVWVIRHGADPAADHGFPDGVRLVNSYTYDMYCEQATAKVWLDNALGCVWWYGLPSEGQCYINTWHGSMGIKRLSGDRYWMSKAALCNKATSYCVTNSTFEEGVFRSSFWPDTPFLKVGHPRNDLLLSPEGLEQARHTVLSHYGLSAHVHIALYAPTFRDGGSIDCYRLDFKRVKWALERRFGGEWLVFVRYHYKTREAMSGMQVSEPWVIDADGYPEMQELMAAADVGITDYSSWAYDYVLTGRPLFIFATDIDAYNDERGFYYPLQETPFPIARDNYYLQENILAFDADAYEKRRQAFLADRGCYETGQASKRVADVILEQMGLQ